MHPSEVQALAGEIAKCLKLVAPSNMGAEQQTVWLHAAVDALEDIRADEVRAISAELRRKVTRPAQIVPEIANLVSFKRSRSHTSSQPVSPYSTEMQIARDAEEMRGKAGHDRSKLSDAWEWERQARIDAGLHVRPYPKPLTASELADMPAHIRQLGLNCAFLVKRDGKITEAA